MKASDAARALFTAQGDRGYSGEAVTLTVHALQTVYQLRERGAGPKLQIAGFLHDGGELVLNQEHPDDVRIHAGLRHERVGAHWAGQFYDDEVTIPIGTHTETKRYLCAVRSGYRRSLSAASEQSLIIQGGPLTGPMVGDFERRPHFRECVMLREADDAAKDPAFPINLLPTLDEMFELLDRLQTRG